MGGTARMSGIPYRPKDMVPKEHGGEPMAPINENRPPDVTYDKDGIVYPKAAPLPNRSTTMPSTTGTPGGRTVVSNAKTVSTETAAEARAAARARKASSKGK